MPVVEHTDPDPDRKSPTLVNITDATRERFLERARKWSEEVKDISWDSLNEDGNRIAGKYGELIFHEVFGGTIDDDYEYDILLDGMKIDVKTSQISVTPLWHYNAVVPADKYRQDCDLYYWVSLYGVDSDDPFGKAWLCGYMEPDEFFEKASFTKQGDRLGAIPSPVNMYSVFYSQLRRRDVPEEIEI